MMLLLLVMMTMVMTMVAPRAESETVGSGADAGHFGATRWWETRAGAPVGSAQQPGKHTLEEPRHQSVRVLPIVKVFCQEETWRMVDQWGSLAQMALPRLLPFLLLVGVLSLQEVEADAVADAASSQVKCSSYSDSIRVCLAIWKKGTERGLSWFINLANIFSWGRN